MPVCIQDTSALGPGRLEGTRRAVSTKVAAFVAAQQESLARLEQFAETPAFQRLLKSAALLADVDADVWLAEWFLQPAFRIDELWLEVALLPGGVEVVEQQLVRVAAGVVS